MRHPSLKRCLAVSARACALIGVLLGGCGKPLFVHVGKVTLADADGVIEAAPGPVLELGPSVDAPLPKIPAGAKIVRLAIARDLPYGRVHELLLAVRAAGAEPVVLVAKQGKIMALPHTVDARSASVLLEATLVGEEAKACIAPPDAEERMCVQRPDARHIDKAFVRELVRQAVKGYDLHHVHVKPDAAITWADTVRALDGARTCCGADVAIAISLEGASL